MSIRDNRISEPPAPSILIVDDNPANLGVVADFLEAYAFNIFTATDGMDALDTVSQLAPDLILLDVMMPGMDGFEVCRRLQADAATEKIPVIFMTALASTPDKIKGFEAGAVDYVTKPVNQEELLARVRTHLQISALTRSLQTANVEIHALNARLQAENLRMEAELDITRRLQQMLLPGSAELAQITELDIAGFMQPAAEVGGDYYDVLCHDGHIQISMGDVTGHGLESGVVMLMVQTAVRALSTGELYNPVRFMDVLNRTLYANLKRIDVDKTLSLTLLDYQRQTGRIKVSGQHEQVIVLRREGALEVQDTIDLGFHVGLVEDITQFVSEQEIVLRAGDGIVLYSDGFTEAINAAGELYGLERLCRVVREHSTQPAAVIKEVAVAAVRQFIGDHGVYDDLALLVIKKK